MAGACKYFVMVAVTAGAIVLSLPQADANQLVVHASNIAALLLYYISMMINGNFCMLEGTV